VRRFDYFQDGRLAALRRWRSGWLWLLGNLRFQTTRDRFGVSRSAVSRMRCNVCPIPIRKSPRRLRNPYRRRRRTIRSG